MYSDFTLPVEVIEGVVDQSADDPSTLKSFSLLCHALFPRARRNLFRDHIVFTSRSHLSAFYSFLDAHPEYQSLIHAIAFYVSNEADVSFMEEVVPIPLLFQLSNLDSWRITGSSSPASERRQ